MKCMLLITGEDVPTSETALLARSLLVEFDGRKETGIFRSCLKQQKEYRKIPAFYIAWLQKQDREVWLNRTRQYLDSFADLIDSHGLNTDNSRRLASNAALSAVGLHAFLEFAVEIEAIDQAYNDSLTAKYQEILAGILKRMILEVNEIKPANLFISTLQELIQAKRVKILDHYVEDHTDRGVPVIGYYKENKKYVCLLPKITMGIVRDVFRRSENEGLNFSTIAVSKQLVEDGYMTKPGMTRLPGAGRGVSPMRMWKLYVSKISGLEED